MKRNPPQHLRDYGAAGRESMNKSRACGNTWFSAAYGANGVYYRVVSGPNG